MTTRPLARVAAVAIFAAFLSVPAAFTAAADKPTTKPAARAHATSQPTKIDVTNRDEIEAHVDKPVRFTAAVDRIRWTASGKTLLITFKDAPADFRAISYEDHRKALDKAFGGDVAQTLDGKTVEIEGVLRRYKGSVEAWQGMTQVAIIRPAQIKLVDEKK